MDFRREGLSPSLSLLMSAFSLPMPPAHLAMHLHWPTERSATTSEDRTQKPERQNTIGPGVHHHPSCGVDPAASSRFPDTHLANAATSIHRCSRDQILKRSDRLVPLHSLLLIFWFLVSEFCLLTSAASVRGLSPVTFSAQDDLFRPVSYYAFFKGWLLLSQPPGCLGLPTSFPT